MVKWLDVRPTPETTKRLKKQLFLSQCIFWIVTTSLLSYLIGYEQLIKPFLDGSNPVSVQMPELKHIDTPCSYMCGTSQNLSSIEVEYFTYETRRKHSISRKFDVVEKLQDADLDHMRRSGVQNAEV
jgi:hypothetical protein